MSSAVSNIMQPLMPDSWLLIPDSPVEAPDSGFLMSVSIAPYRSLSLPSQSEQYPPPNHEYN